MEVIRTIGIGEDGLEDVLNGELGFPCLGRIP